MNKKVILISVALVAILLTALLMGLFQENPTSDVQLEAGETTGEPTTEPTRLTDPYVQDWGEDTAPTETETQPKDAETEPVDETTVPETTAPGENTSGYLTYEEYMALSPAERQAYFESFPSEEAAFAWYDQAWADYLARQDVVDIQGGDVDLGDLMDGGNGG